MMRLKAQVFGPGFPSAGALLEFEADDKGIRLATADINDGAPRWSAIELRKSGWDGKQLRLEWKGRAGLYSLLPAEANAGEVLRKLSAGRAQAVATRPDVATRAWVHTLLWGSLVLPLLLIGVVAWQHERIAAWAVGQISVEQEAKLGELLFAQHKLQLKLVEGPAQEMVREIGGRLTSGARHKYRFFVAEDRSVNAFAMPGGYVVMHTGLMQLAETPEEVAGVLAHEVQHVEQRHSLRGMAQSLGLYAALTLLAGDLSGIASLGSDLLKLKFSRDHETEADREGLKTLVAAKINPTGMRDFFGRMAAQSKLDLGILSTHPASSERMADLDQRIKELPEDAKAAPSLAAALGIDYAAIKASLGPRK